MYYYICDLEANSKSYLLTQQGGKPFTAVRDKQLVPSFLEQRPSALGASPQKQRENKMALRPSGFPWLPLPFGYRRCASWASILHTVPDIGLAKRFIRILRGKTRMTLLANPIYSHTEDNRPKDPDLFEF